MNRYGEVSLACGLMVLVLTVGSANADLVAHWKFDGDANDSVGTNHGVVYGAQSTDGVLGGALVFDGQDDYVSLPHLAVTTTKFTIAAWANHYGSGGGPDHVNVIFSQRDDSSGSGRSAITLASESTTSSPNPYAAAVIRSNEGPGQSLTSPAMDYHRWHHYAMTVDSEVFIFYIDGVEVERTPNQQSGDYITSIDHITVGQERYLGNDRRFFNGAIDDLRVYDDAVSADVIAFLAANDAYASLVGHWTFDTDGTDSVGTNHGVVYGAQSTDGVLGGALVFDGQDDYVSLPHVAVTTEEFTVAAWANHYGPGGGPEEINVIFSQRDWDPGNNRATISLVTEAQVELPYPYAGAAIRSTSGSNQTLKGPWQNYHEWHHYAITVDSDYLILFIDGLEVDRVQNNQSGNYTAGVDQIGIGKSTVFEVDRRFFNGAIDDVRVYDEALSPEAIGALAAAGAGVFPVAHWKFDGDANDSVGTNHGVIYGAQSTDGVLGGALVFDGQDDYVLGSTSPFDFANMTFTASAWFKKLDAEQGVIVSEGGRYSGWRLTTLSSGQIMVHLKKSNSYDAYVARTTDAYAGGQWHHVAAVITTDTSGSSGNNADIYVDGNLVDVTHNKIGPYGVSTTGWTIGTREAGYDYFFKGIIDDVRIYDRALSSAEIAGIYYSSAPPVADANGPYTLYAGDTLTLDASGSTDDENDITSYVWDLNDDGVFETDAGRQAVFDVSYAYLESLGIVIDVDYNIHLKVTDGDEQGDTDTTTLTVEPKPALVIAVDIKPTSCPNPLNVKSKGVLPVAILGSDIFDVTTIDATSIRLKGVGPVRHSFEDVAAPGLDVADCNCIEEGPDGFIDLTLKFKTQEIVEVLGEVEDGDVITLELTGVLFGEIPIEGADCILIRGRHKPINPADINKDGVVNVVDFAIFTQNWLQSSIVDD